jgi:hypothetical protein
VEQSPFWEANNCLSIQDILRSFWNPKVHCRVYKRLPLDPILSQANKHPHVLFNLLKLILPFTLSLVFLSTLFPSEFQTNIMCTVFTPVLHATWSSHPSLYFITLFGDNKYHGLVCCLRYIWWNTRRFGIWLHYDSVQEVLGSIAGVNNNIGNKS